MSGSDELLERLERLAQRYEANHLPDHARGVRHAAREVRAYFAPVELRRSVGVESAEEADMCRPVEVDGQIVRVRGEREMNDTARAALAEVVAAAKRELAAESNQETK